MVQHIWNLLVTCIIGKNRLQAFKTFYYDHFLKYWLRAHSIETSKLRYLIKCLIEELGSLPNQPIDFGHYSIGPPAKRHSIRCQSGSVSHL